jgi:serine/threonine protein kinase
MSWKIGEVVENRYRISRVFAGGGMGIVYLARHLAWDMDLAIKHPRPEFLQSGQQRRDFEKECETWSRLGLHPFLATCFYTREIGNLPCVVAEYVEGGSLRDWIDSRRIYAGEEAAAIARILRVATAMAWGLDQAHHAGLIHCDIKPGNALMAADGMAKVTDFGLAKIVSGSGGSAVAGGLTAAYASPEQVRRDPITHATDVWSWGVSVMEIFMGGIQWQSGPVAGAALEQFAERGRKAVGLPAMPTAVFELLARCLRHRPDERPGFSEIAEELREIYEDEFGEPCEVEKPDLELLAADSLNNRAVSLLDIGRDADAEDLIRQALTIDPHHPEATFNLAIVCKSRNEEAESWAIPHMRIAADAEPGNPAPVKLLAQIFSSGGRHDEAERCFDEAKQRAWTSSEKAEIDELRSRDRKKHLAFVFAKPRSGSDFCADMIRFRRLMDKAETAIAENREADARRYAQMSADIQGFGRHPRLSRVLARLKD